LWRCRRSSPPPACQCCADRAGLIAGKSTVD
jgi:hypothetical protein